jgi:hypothetical protein
MEPNMSDIPQEDIALATEHLSDDEIILTLLRTVSNLGVNFDPLLSDRLKTISEKYEARLPLRRKLEKNQELARELIQDYPIYGHTSGLTYDEMVDMCVVLGLDEAEDDE